MNKANGLSLEAFLFLADVRLIYSKRIYLIVLQIIYFFCNTVKLLKAEYFLKTYFFILFSNTTDIYTLIPNRIRWDIY